MIVQKGSKVEVEYEGKLETGEVFDSSTHGDHSHPIEFVVGEGKVIRGFDDAVVGMKEGEEKEVVIESKDAYGEKSNEMIKEVPRSALPPEQEPEEGMVLIMGTPDGGKFPVKIVKVNEEMVSLDLNHPLAGKKLIFNIKVVGVKSNS